MSSSFAALLPSPKRSHDVSSDVTPPAERAVVAVDAHIPPYGQRSGWTPRSERDFADGGAFPEILCAQYPRGLGRKDSTISNALAVELDANGDVRYDALLRQNSSRDRVVYHRLQDLLPEEITDEDALQKPTDEQIHEKTEE